MPPLLFRVVYMRPDRRPLETDSASPGIMRRIDSKKNSEARSFMVNLVAFQAFHYFRSVSAIKKRLANLRARELRPETRRNQQRVAQAAANRHSSPPRTPAKPCTPWTSNVQAPGLKCSHEQKFRVPLGK